MKEKLIQYVDLLFAGATGSEEIKQEILQNTLDRYDDLIAEGRSPESAYRIAISGIGDINEILGQGFQTRSSAATAPSAPSPCKGSSKDSSTKKILRAVAVGLYIISLVPLIILSEMHMATLGFCATLGICAVATVMIVLGSKSQENEQYAPPYPPKSSSPSKALCESICHTLWVVALVLFFLISFLTGAWFITWLIFPVAGAVQGLIKAIFDLKEANNHET